MKIRPLCCSDLGAGARALLAVALACGALACSSDGSGAGEPPSPGGLDPLDADPAGAPAPVEPGAGEPSPAATPLSAPSPDESGPGATETNFLVPPCRRDSDCRAGWRCEGAGDAGSDDAGASGPSVLAGDAGSDAGDAGDAGSRDAGAPDAAPGDGPGLGRCVEPSG